MHKIDLIMAPHPFFHGMCEHHLKILAELAQPAHFPKGTFVFREGELANRFYLIRNGRVSLEASVGGETRIALQELGDGDVLGWSWLFPPYFWHFDARALENTDALDIAGTRLREYCEAEKAFGYEIFQRVATVVVQRLQSARLKMVQEFHNAGGLPMAATS